MTEVEISLVRSSLSRCSDQLEFFDFFYERLIRTSSAVAEKLSGTDIDHQMIMLRGSLDMLISAASTGTACSTGLEHLAALHSRQGVDIPPALYTDWMDALMAAVKAFDPQYDAPLEHTWRRVLTPGIRFMTARYQTSGSDLDCSLSAAEPVCLMG